MEIIFVILVLLFSVIVHEVSHGYAALWLGDPTAKYEGRLTLNPLKHLDPIGSFIVPLLGYLSGGIIIGWAKPVPFNPFNLRNQKWGEAIVAIAGPLSNIFIAIVFALIIRGSNGLMGESFIFLASYVVFINIILALFNLTPIPPLDGSKILFSLFPYRLESLRITIEKYGLFLVIIFILFVWQYIAPFSMHIFELLVGRSFL